MLERDFKAEQAPLHHTGAVEGAGPGGSPERNPDCLLVCSFQDPSNAPVSAAVLPSLPREQIKPTQSDPALRMELVGLSLRDPPMSLTSWAMQSQNPESDQNPETSSSFLQVHHKFMALGGDQGTSAATMGPRGIPPLWNRGRGGEKGGERG